MKCTHTTPSLFIVILAASGLAAQIVTYTAKVKQELSCDFSSSENSGQWGEILPNTTTVALFALSSGQVIPLKPQQVPKYEDFSATWDNDHFNLEITNVDKDDGGTYLCTRLTATAVTIQLVVEVVSNVVISYVYNETGVVEVGKTYTFTCTAQGVRSPNNLQLVWSTEDSTDDSGTGTTRDVNEDDNSLEDLTSTYILSPKKTDTFIRCSITGYETQQELSDAVITESVQLEVQYLPECTLSLEKEDGCTQITLMCDCTAKPDVHNNGYSFYQNDTLIQDSERDSSITVEVDLDSTTVFYCTATNDVGVGPASNKEDHECSSNPPFKWWIILICVVVVSAGVGIGVTVYCYCFKKPSNSSKGNNSVRDDESDIVLATSNQGTHSSPPVYGVIDKDKKKKSDDNTDGNGKNSTNSDPPEYAAVNKPLKNEPTAAPRSSAPSAGGEPEKMELQYADIDHGNRGPSNEIRQPADAPTEYATVQSVIV